jgi:hypothetical protein
LNNLKSTIDIHINQIKTDISINKNKKSLTYKKIDNIKETLNETRKNYDDLLSKLSKEYKKME